MPVGIRRWSQSSSASEQTSRCQMGWRNRHRTNRNGHRSKNHPSILRSHRRETWKGREHQGSPLRDWRLKDVGHWGLLKLQSCNNLGQRWIKDDRWRSRKVYSRCPLRRCHTHSIQQNCLGWRSFWDRLFLGCLRLCWHYRQHWTICSSSLRGRTRTNPHGIGGQLWLQLLKSTFRL